ncbi:hypothetical protein DH2020_040971 [Rehmannia glutinosa]|uniref:CCHC-type domain-containing protein n=1 Tax=Rehmannia glutinosa TaxID=99300 RepID=A0ABR0URM4_REHGL
MARCLVAKVFSAKRVNRNTFKQHIPRILQATKQIDIDVVGENLFALEFQNLIDRKRAINGGPWHFFRNLVIFKEMSGTQNPELMEFNYMEIWVECHNIPIVCMQESHILIKDENDVEEFMVLLTYEKLPDFCYTCGKVGHTWRECADEDNENQGTTYGNWLRATLPVGGLRNRGGGTDYKQENEMARKTLPKRDSANDGLNTSDTERDKIYEEDESGEKDCGGHEEVGENHSKVIIATINEGLELLESSEGNENSQLEMQTIENSGDPQISEVSTGRSPKKWKTRARSAGQGGKKLKLLEKGTKRSQWDEEEIGIDERGDNKRLNIGGEDTSEWKEITDMDTNDSAGIAMQPRQEP